jgi:hypothetical protein
VRRDMEHKKMMEGKKQYVNETQRMIVNGEAVKFPF